MSGSRTTRWLPGSVLVLVLAAVTILPLLGSGVTEYPRGAVQSKDGDGWRAAFLLLGEFGHAPERWTGSPGLLPRGEQVLLMAQPPKVAELGEGFWSNEEDDLAGSAPRKTFDGEDDPLRRARQGGLSADRHYRGFVEQGGTLVICGGPAVNDFLVNELGIAAFATLTYREPRDAERPARTLDGESLTLAFNLGFELDLPGAWPRETLITDEDGEPLVLEVRVGRGSVVLLADDGRAFSNEGLKRADHGPALVRLAEWLEGGFLFDEWALGLGAPGTAFGLAFGPRGRGFTWHLILLIGLFAWMHAWAREFPRDPAPLEQLSPLARARAQVGLFQRAGRVDLFAQMLRSGTLSRLAGRHAAAAHSTEPGSAPLDAELVVEVAQQAGQGSRTAHWLELFVGRSVDDLEQLADLDQDLRLLEREVHQLREARPETSRRGRHHLSRRRTA